MTSSRFHQVRWIWLLALAVTGALAWLGVERWTSLQPLSGDASEDMARATADPVAPPLIADRTGPLRLALGPLGGADAAGDAIVADLLVSDLSTDPDMVLLERRDQRRLWDEIALGAAGAIRPQEAIRLGQLLRADWFLLGSPYRSGTNASSVVRLVDAHSGILRDLLVLPDPADKPEQAARQLASFVRRHRSARLSEADPPTFVAVGGFTDQSLRPRLTGVEAELREGLTTALSAQRLVIVERELTRLLLDELRWQQAGLTVGSATHPQMQSAFWLVDGFWQSVGSGGNEVELTVRAARSGGSVGRSRVVAERGPALDEAAQRTTLELIRSAASPGRFANRRRESTAQIERGLERARWTPSSVDPWRMRMEIGQHRYDDDATRARRRDDLLAAQSSFESALLLDPDSVPARLYLARCLIDPAVGRPAEARDLYGELLGHTNRTRALQARIALGLTYWTEGEPGRAAEWYRGLWDRETAEDVRRAYQPWLDIANGESGGTTERSQFESRLMERILTCQREAKEGRTANHGEFRGFVARRPGGLTEGQAHLLEFFPKLVAAAPELESMLLSRALPVLPWTNNPLIVRFETLLARLAQQAESIVAADRFYDGLNDVFYWASQGQLHSLEVALADTMIAAHRARLVNEQRPEVGYLVGHALAKAHRWRKAIQQLDSIKLPVVVLDQRGPWGEYPSFVVPSQLAARCRRELGEPPVEDPLRFEIGAPMLTNAVPFGFLRDGDRVWLACCDRLTERSLDGRILRSIRLDTSDERPPRALALSQDSVWIGTVGGLIRVDKSTATIRRYTSKDGLMLDGVSALHLAGDRLWIGQDNAPIDGMPDPDPAGALSLLQLSTGRIKSFTPSLPADQPEASGAGGPPRLPVRAVVQQGGETIWLGIHRQGIWKARPSAGTWTAVSSPGEMVLPSCLVASDRWAVAGNAPRPRTNRSPDPLLVDPMDNSGPFLLGPRDGLPFPSVTTLALDEDRLWVGGPGYLAILDLPSRRVIRRCLLENTDVQGLTLVGDDVWVRLNCSLHSLPRSLGIP